VQTHAAKQQQHSSAQDLQSIADQDHLPPVEAIGRVAGRQHKKQSGQKQRQPRIAQVQRPVRDGIYLPGNRHRLSLGAQNDRRARQLVPPEIA